jgi:hypothetical protein
MKLSSTQAQWTLEQLEDHAGFGDAVVIPDDNPNLPKLNSLFGDHTFFIGSAGLHIVEPTVPDTETAHVIEVASWQDASRSTLVRHDPEPTDIVVALEPKEPPDDIA